MESYIAIYDKSNDHSDKMIKMIMLSKQKNKMDNNDDNIIYDISIRF